MSSRRQPATGHPSFRLVLRPIPGRERFAGFAAALLLILAAAPCPARAADEPAGEPTGDGAPAAREASGETFRGEILVTARKREENVQEIPIAITAFSDDDLESRSMRDLASIADFIPNVDFSASAGTGGASSEATVYIRGVGQVETGIMADPGVGIYVDGVYIARSQGAISDLLDVERVEVLRGPQGTLFGKNTTGGAIHLITRKPGPDFDASLSATAGNLDRHDLAVRVGGGLSERVFGSVAAQATHRDGWVTSLENGGVFNSDNRDSARASLRFLPTDDFTVDLSLDWSRERETAFDQKLVEVFGSPILDFFNRVRADGGLETLNASHTTGGLYESHSDGPSRNDGDILLATLRLSRQWRNVGVLSITAWRDYEYLGDSDFDGSPVRFFQRSYRQTQDQLSQEIQLTGDAAGDRLSWVAGALYFEEHPVDDSVTHAFDQLFELLEAAPGPIYSPPGVPAFLCDPGPPPPGLPCFGGAGNPFNLGFFFGDGAIDLLEIDTASYAAFGEGTWALSGRLSLTAGLRYTYDDKSADFTAHVTPEILPRRHLSDARTWDAFSPRASLAYQARDNLLIYASVSQGFKSGGFNAARALDQNSLFPYDPETLWAYEAGFKSDLADRRLRLNTSLFYYDYDDVQFATFLPIDGQQFFAIQNATDARITGGELELEAHPATGLSISAGIGYVDSEYTDLRYLGGPPMDGVFPKTPRWKGVLSGQYAFEAAGGSFIARADYSWRDDFFHDVVNGASTAQEAYGLLGARLTYAPNASWEIALSGTNLTRQEYFEHAFYAEAAGSAIVVAGRPREWGLTAQLRF